MKTGWALWDPAWLVGPYIQVSWSWSLIVESSKAVYMSFFSISNRLLHGSCLNFRYGFINLDDFHHYWLCDFRILKVQFPRRTWTLSRTYLIMAYAFFYPLNSDPYVNATCRLRCFILLHWMIKSYLYTPGSLPPYPIHWFFALFILMEMPTSTFIHISYLNNVDRMFQFFRFPLKSTRLTHPHSQFGNSRLWVDCSSLWSDSGIFDWCWSFDCVWRTNDIFVSWSFFSQRNHPHFFVKVGCEVPVFGQWWSNGIDGIACWAVQCKSRTKWLRGKEFIRPVI